MFENLYRWIQELAVWLVISAAALQAVPGKNYVKYIRFFTGLVTVLLFIAPVLKLTGTDQTLEYLWEEKQQTEQNAEEEKFKKILKEAESLEWMGSRPYEAAEDGKTESDTGEIEKESRTGSEGSRIRVEEIEIGK